MLNIKNYMQKQPIVNIGIIACACADIVVVICHRSRVNVVIGISH
jgi:hypothetical protein